MRYIDSDHDMDQDGSGRGGRGRRSHHEDGPRGPGAGRQGGPRLHDRPHGHRGGGGGGRRMRGDVRSAILMLLREGPMHGYQLMEAIAERSEGRWRPSPGAVYPTLSQLQDEGVITLTAAGGRRDAALTDQGRELVDAEADGWSDPFTAAAAGGDDAVDLRGEMGRLHEAVRVVGRSGTPAQRSAVAALLTDARRQVYLVLAGDPAGAPETGDSTTPADEKD
ncbi:PadR family transcriptional regulator [Actinotalea sp. K2]|uniref:PadR family transcriptional regulator n=1 Tax=Actinotalea sp. K2 TaxID=2939438 RepID=UPI0020175E1A|nr:PadR family transcriptional regulator [Actinotalea sp. K2]MCL3862975.1 PadR family transcriptional regulator [Actinotalea sp. K2]